MESAIGETNELYAVTHATGYLQERAIAEMLRR